MNRWYEVWADETISPPYLLVVEPINSGFRILDPKENGKIVFETSDFDEIRNWLLEDEYVFVSGRMSLDN